MPPPSQLAISTSAVTRLVKEEQSYHKELVSQEARIAKLEKGGDDENQEFLLKQEKRAADETRAIFPELKKRIQEGVERLQNQLEQDKEAESTSPEEITKAKEAVVAGLAAIREVA